MSEEQVNGNTSEKNLPQFNYLKTRDDSEMVSFEASENGKFKLSPGTKCSWISEGQEFAERELRPRIEPWLTSLFQSEHLSLLAGSGLTHAVHLLAAGTNAADMGTSTFTELSNEISKASKVSAACADRTEGNNEDRIRVANELLRGLEILEDARANQVRNDIINNLKTFSQSILTSETGIATAPEESREKAFNMLINFLMSFASRTGTRDRLNIFTTNYDRLIEAGAELAGLHLLDRFFR